MTAPKNPFWLRPFQFEGTAMLPNVLLMCKLLVLLLIAHHFIFKIGIPFIPFIKALDDFHTYPNVFKLTLQLLFIVSTILLTFNLYVRTSALILGSIVILHILGSKPAFYNHALICGCALFLAGLTNNKQPPYLLFLQLTVVYLGASINKMTDQDWWSGAFMNNWLAVSRENPFYLYVQEFFPRLVLAKLLSWAAFSTEFIIAMLLLFKKTRTFAVWFIIIFHTLLFTMTSTRFGHFLESLVIILIGLSTWPKTEMVIVYKENRLKFFRKLISFFDWDKKMYWKPNTSENKALIKLTIDQKTSINDKAIKKIILYSPAFYLFLMFMDMAIYVILYYHRTALFIINVITVWPLIIYFLPIPWIRYFEKKT